jgi:hypothetical protein
MSPQQLQRLVGARISDAGYASTSVTKNVAQNFSAGRVLIRAHLPKGTRGVYVHGTTLSSHKEYDVILPRATELTVTRVSHDGHYYIVDVEVAAQPVTKSLTSAQVAQGVTHIDDLISKIAQHAGHSILEMSEAQIKASATLLGISPEELTAVMDQIAEIS